MNDSAPREHAAPQVHLRRCTRAPQGPSGLCWRCGQGWGYHELGPLVPGSMLCRALFEREEQKNPPTRRSWPGRSQ